MGAFGDLTAGLLFVFLAAVMALALTSGGWPGTRAIATSITAATPAPDKPFTGTPVERRAKVVAALQGALATDGVEVYVDLEDGVLRLPEQLLFDTGKAAFKPTGELAVQALARHLATFLPKCGGLEAVVIEGHTDNQPVQAPYDEAFGHVGDNWDLSFIRAKHTYAAVLAAAPLVGGLRNHSHEAVLCIGAFGPSRPVGDNAIEGGRLLNRRIDVRLVVESDDALRTRRPGRRGNA